MNAMNFHIIFTVNTLMVKSESYRDKDISRKDQSRYKTGPRLVLSSIFPCIFQYFYLKF